MKLHKSNHYQQEIKNRGGSILVCENVIQEAVQIAKTLVTKPKESLKLLKQKISNEILVELEDHIEKEEVMHEKTFHTKEVSKLIEKHFSGGNLRKIEKRKTNKILLSDLEDTGSNILKKNSLITLNESDPISTNDSVQDYILKPVNQLEKTKDSQEKPSFETSRVYYEKDTLLISSKLKSVFEQVLHIPYEDLDEEATFVDIGLDSISGVEAIRLINEEFKINLEAVVLYDYYNIEELSELIIKKY